MTEKPGSEDRRVFDRIMSNGKRLGDCTVAELREMAEQWRKELPRRLEQYLRQGRGKRP
jgi:hypothetical protein